MHKTAIVRPISYLFVLGGPWRSRGNLIAILCVSLFHKCIWCADWIDIAKGSTAKGLCMKWLSIGAAAMCLWLVSATAQPADVQSESELPTSALEAVAFERLDEAYQETVFALDQTAVIAAGVIPGWPQGLQGYDPVLFRTAVAEGKRRTVNIFDGDQLSGLRSYVNSSFPTPKLEYVKRFGKRLISPASASAYAVLLEVYFKRLRDISPLALDVGLVSDPPLAAVNICSYEFPHCISAPATAVRASAATDTVLLSFYRGVYWYRVEKAGFKTVSGLLNLVDSKGRVLNCRLLIASKSGPALPCNLE